jgi:adenylate cyclase
MAESQKTSSLLGELKQLKSLIGETAASLRSQRDILKMRGMKLPPLVLSAVESLTGELDKLENGIINDTTELGQLRSLADTSAALNSSLDLDMVLHRSMEVVITLTGAERGYIVFIDSDTGELDFRITNESALMPVQGGATPQISQTVLNEVLETGEALLADNAYKDERLQSGASIAQLSLRSVLCVPLKYKAKVVGVVYVDNRLRSGVFTDREKTLLVAFANQASIAIENARLFQSIQKTLGEISEMKALMDNVFQSIGSGVVTTNAAHAITLFNRAASEILEHSAEDATGSRLNKVLSSISADLDSQLAKVRETATPQILETEMQVPQRGRIAISMKFNPLRNVGNRNEIQGVAMVMDDLTDKRERDQMMGVMRRYLPPEMVDNIHAIAQIDLGGERREVSCIFLEVRPISSFPKNFRPQQVMEAVNVYLECATEVIHEYQGVIDKYIGTDIMVLFNTQLNPMDDHALRGVKTALAIRDAFIDLYDKLGLNPDPHYYRIGLHTGIATLGNVGSLHRREFTAIGDTINLSKRLEENAVSGQIIVSQNVRDHIKKTNGSLDGIRFEEREAVKVKGRTTQTRIYEVFKS